MDDDPGLEAERGDDGKWRWTYTSPGGAFHLAPFTYKTKAAAVKAGRAWLQDFEAKR